MLYKIVLAGDSGCGKTSIIYRHIRNEFDIDSATTYGGACNTLQITSPGGYKLKMQLWDTAGQEKYRSLVKIYYRGAYVIIFVFDLSRIETRKNIQNWYTEYTTSYPDKIHMFLVGNKSDIAQEDPEILSLIKTYIAKYHFRYVKTSARDGTGIDVLFDDISARIGLNYDFEVNNNQSEQIKLELTQETVPKASLNYCCT